MGVAVVLEVLEGPVTLDLEGVVDLHVVRWQR